LAESLGVTLARDPARDDLPPGPVAYGRISSLGAGGRVRGSAIERAADRLADFAEAYVVIEGDNALRAAKELRGLLGASQNGAADDDGVDEDDEEELDEDEDGDDDFEDEDEESWACACARWRAPTTPFAKRPLVKSWPEARAPSTRCWLVTSQPRARTRACCSAP
jgi:hypothetical protein